MYVSLPSKSKRTTATRLQHYSALSKQKNGLQNGSKADGGIEDNRVHRTTQYPQLQIKKGTMSPTRATTTSQGNVIIFTRIHGQFNLVPNFIETTYIS